MTHRAEERGERARQIAEDLHGGDGDDLFLARLLGPGLREHVRAQCDAPWLVLDLTVQRRCATLTAINGMPFIERDPLHTCVRELLRGLDFPRADKPAKFSLPIDLSPKDRR